MWVVSVVVGFVCCLQLFDDLVGFCSDGSLPNSKFSFLFYDGISGLVSDEDLKGLIRNLEGETEDGEIWENVIQKSNDRVSYNAECCKPKDGGPMKYLSVTVFEDCSPEVLRDFYMDNDYRKQWDKTIVGHEQLEVDSTSGVEIGRTIKKFPLLTPREYVLAWRLWEGNDNLFFCFIKECDHNLAPRQRKHIRVGYFRSGWRIRKVPGRSACEIKMFHRENAGLNSEMAKLAFSRGIWSYICKMDNALRRYIATSPRPPVPSLSAVSSMRKVPSEFETERDDTTDVGTSGLDTSDGVNKREVKGKKKPMKRPSKKLIAKGLILVGGVICLSRGHSALGAKVALAYFLTKLRKKHGASPTQTSQDAIPI
ncbi:PREDICTED: phosphatidylcholine transfer protein isoform X2 [Tarenaya hassleriana]|uniref:phosphatidylcholine transfer protein isoform X2 n=1 Tax=Tarenaya hassleriana TaxID=28532 RepID=UPI0008FD5106|nr:PREDICTED: phosphatidylcholine transfer protein isoform X2 [Tarenaya hassleriana]